MNHYYHIYKERKRKLKTNHDIRTSTMHIPYQPAPYLTPRSDAVMKSRRRDICIDPGDQSETAYLLMMTSAGTRMQSQRWKWVMWGVEDPAQEHRFPWDHKYTLSPWERRRPYRLRDRGHYSRPSMHTCCAGDVFSSLFLYCSTPCTDTLICWQGLCITTKGTNLDTYHQTVIPISSLSSLWLYKAYPSNHV